MDDHLFENEWEQGSFYCGRNRHTGGMFTRVTDEPPPNCPFYLEQFLKDAESEGE